MNFVEIFCVVKLKSLGYFAALFSEILHLSVLVVRRLAIETINLLCKGRTVGLTRDDSKYRTIA